MTQCVLMFGLGVVVGTVGMFWLLRAALNNSAGRATMRAKLDEHYPEDNETR